MLLCIEDSLVVWAHSSLKKSLLWRWPVRDDAFAIGLNRLFE